MSDKSLPDASFIAAGRTYHGIFRLPHGRWQTLCGKDGKPLIFADAIAATRAAMAKMNTILFQPIRAQRANDPDPMAAKILGEFGSFKDRREEQRVADRRIFRKGGKPPVIVETRRIRA